MKIAAKLDASPHIVWNWRFILRTPSFWINAIGAGLSFLIGAALWISPLLGVVWVAGFPIRLAMTITFVLFLAAVIARFLTQKNGTPATAPDDDDTTHA